MFGFPSLIHIPHRLIKHHKTVSLRPSTSNGEYDQQYPITGNKISDSVRFASTNGYNQTLP
jgi:hypothetical protein